MELSDQEALFGHYLQGQVKTQEDMKDSPGD